MSEEITKKLSYKSLFTRSAANEGIKVDLYLPSGVKSGFWLRIIGKNSDTYRKGSTALTRLGIKLGDVSEDEISKAFDEATVKILADCVIDWNLEDDEGKELELNDKNKIELFEEAPQIKDQVDRVISSQTLFSKKK
jgi:hypothetical protein